MLCSVYATPFEWSHHALSIACKMQSAIKPRLIVRDQAVSRPRIWQTLVEILRAHGRQSLSRSAYHTADMAAPPAQMTAPPGSSFADLLKLIFEPHTLERTDSEILEEVQ